VPVNVVMGELGAGKTTVIFSLVRQLAGDDYTVVWLKNEYGDVNVDSRLAQSQGIKTEQLMNGCLCCTAIGQLETAVEAVLKLEPDRLIVESAGTAHPAPIAMELKRFPDVRVDSFCEVIDVANFKGFNGQGIVRQSHARYIDFLVLNKLGLVDERRLDEVLDKVLEIYPETPLVRTGDGTVPADLLIGVDRVTAVSGLSQEQIREDSHSPTAHPEQQAFSFRGGGEFRRNDLAELLEQIPVRDVYRVKGLVRADGRWLLVNRVANRTTWEPVGFEPAENQLLFVGPYADDHRAGVTAALKERLRR
jgi:G3E family GTPase